MGETEKKKKPGKISTGMKIVMTLEDWHHEKVVLRGAGLSNIKENLYYKEWFDFLVRHFGKPYDVREDLKDSRLVWANYRFRDSRSKGSRVNDYIVVLIRSCNKKREIATANDYAKPKGGTVIWESDEKKKERRDENL